MLEFVGPSQHLYICGVNRGFHACYHKAKDEKCAIHCKTSYRTAFESVSRLTLAVQSGLELVRVHYKAGRYASIEVLHEAQKTLGLRFSTLVLRGAARSGHLSKLQWLVNEQNVLLCDDTAEEAAENGSVGMMQWLHLKEVAMTAAVMRAAAINNHMALTQYLRSIGTPWGNNLPQFVSESGHLDVLKHVLSDGCPILTYGFPASASALAYPAARGCQQHILEWLTIDHGVVLAAHDTLSGAASRGHVSLMKWLKCLRLS